MRAEFINPFVTATVNVFQTMLGTTLTRGAIGVRAADASPQEVSGLIGLAGRYQGMVVVGLSSPTAMQIAQTMLGSPVTEVNADVTDAVGEITNMIAGAAKSKLEEYKLSIGLPTVICAPSLSITFPSGSTPLVIPFDSQLGRICIEVGLVESKGA
jgi:chemotaxis protein CheX